MDSNKLGHHISEQFNKELEDIRNKVLIMGCLLEQQIDLAVQAFTTGNIEIAEVVIKQDNQVDEMEMAIDQECTEILARRQPTAFDLRLLMSVIKIVHELERVGDKAKRVSEMAIQLGGGNGKVTYYEIEHMAELVKSMLHDALDAFARLDLANLSQITERDENVDREYDNILRQLITRMMEDPRHITRALDVLWTVRALERIGDHACYICEHLIYIVKGEDVRHLTQHQLEEKINH